MYKILALNCLITAWALSVQYLDGIKYGDYQMSITGALMSVCFLCISRAKVYSMSILTKQSYSRFMMTSLLRNYPRSARWATSSISTFCSQSSSSSRCILSQWCTSRASRMLLSRTFILLVSLILRLTVYTRRREGLIDLDAKFEPSLLNTAIYLLGLSQQVSTFAINYQGRPFREGIRENKFLYYGLIGASAVAFSGATDFMPEMNRWLQVVEMTGSVRDSPHHATTWVPTATLY